MSGRKPKKASHKRPKGLDLVESTPENKSMPTEVTEVPQDPTRLNYVSLIWSIAEILRGDFKAHQYGSIVLPFVVLRRLECVLEPTRKKVLEASKTIPKGADEAIREKLKALPGVQIVMAQPISDRVDEMVTGVRSDIAVKVFGDDLDNLKRLANQIAKEAEFFSFGTNDLTQTTFGLSRDDAGNFLGHYQKDNILTSDPFAELDCEGVGELIKIATEKGKATRPNIKLGICGEHGGNPASIEFCQQVGLNYVSCSPYRVPIAKLSAAQAVLKQRKS
jgi:hypothetical protein